MYTALVKISECILPLFLLVVFLHAVYKRVPVYDTFVEGAKEGFGLAVKLIPYVVGIYVAVGMFRDSGAMDAAIFVLKPLLSIADVPGEIIPLLITRPLSGPASLGITVELMNRFGPDSFIGRLASTIDGSTDTTLYIIAVYFASVGIRKARYSLAVGLLADAAGFCAAIYVCSRVFG